MSGKMGQQVTQHRNRFRMTVTEPNGDTMVLRFPTADVRSHAALGHLALGRSVRYENNTHPLATSEGWLTR